MTKLDENKIEEFYTTVGKNIKNARIGADISQASLANRIGFNRSSLANLEAGRQRVSLHLFLLIASAIDVTPDALLPDIKIFDETSQATNDILNEHLIGTTSTTQDFVRGTMARVTKIDDRSEDEE